MYAKLMPREGTIFLTGCEKFDLLFAPYRGGMEGDSSMVGASPYPRLCAPVGGIMGCGHPIDRAKALS